MRRPSPAACELGRNSPYRSLFGVREGLLRAQTRRLTMRAVGGTLLLALALACGACSAVPLAGDDDLVTGSITPRPVTQRSGANPPPQGVSSTDWQAATKALEQALASPESDISVSWENAETGARGTATPIGAMHAGGCRDFMIAVVTQDVADRWVKGAACRGPRGTVLSQVRLLGEA